MPTRLGWIWWRTRAVGTFSPNVRGYERVGDDWDERGHGGRRRREVENVVDEVEDGDDDEERRWRRCGRGEFCDAYRRGKRRERVVLRAGGGTFV